MLSMIKAALMRSRTVLMIFVLLLIAGWNTYLNIPKEANPDITIPIIYVSMTHDGISPEDAERLLVRPMENELRAIEGVDEMRSNASEGHASVTLEFVAGLDPKDALADVRDKVTLAKAKLPGDTEEPTVNEVTLADEEPVLTVILSGNVTERGLVSVARELQDKLEGMDQVLEVDVGGDREDIVEIIIDPLKLESYGLDQNDIFNLLSRNNLLVPAGTLDNGFGRFAIKIPSVFETVEDIFSQPVKVKGDQVIAFGDIASVRRAYKDPTSFARLNGQRAVSLEIKKRPGENIIQTVDEAKTLIEQEQQKWPNHIVVTYTRDQSEDVRDMLGDLQNNVLSAVLLVVIVIIAILGARTASLVGISIPGSFLTGILVISLFGLTINIVVLFSLIMAVGMLVDGAIVVTEFADRLMSEGIERKKAYQEAAIRMAWPITASTATTLAAFAPLIFWPGIMGEFMKYLPITLIATLTASLFMALVFVPTIGTLIGKSRPLSAKKKEQMLHAEQGDLNKLTGFIGWYVKVLSSAIQNPIKVLILAILISTAVFMGYGKSNLGVEFFPQVEPQGVNVTVRSYGDLSIYEKDKIMRIVEVELLGRPEIETLYSRTTTGDDIGRIRMNFVDWQLRPKADAILEELREKMQTLSGIEIEFRKDQNGPGSGKDLVIELNSRFPEKLNTAIHTIKNELAQWSELTNISDSGSKPGIEWQLNLNRADAARFGADASFVGNTIQMVTNGLKVGEYRPDDVDDELDILIRFPKEKRGLDKLDDIRIKTDQGLVPIGNFIKRTAKPKVDTIRRVDGRRVLNVSADMMPGKQLSKLLPLLQEKFPELGIDPSVNLVVKGENEDQAESEAFLKNAFFIALFVMAIILVTQFNSFYQAFLILSAVLFSTVGVFLGLILIQKPFGIVMSGIGVIALAGIVVNNNIVLIDTYNVLRRQGLPALEAILRTGAQRLRPVMLTTVTTVLGLMPMVLEMNIDLVKRTIEFGGPSTQWWSQLASAVAGGLAFATVLTLILTPSLLALGYKTTEYLQRRKHKKDNKPSQTKTEKSEHSLPTGGVGEAA